MSGRERTPSVGQTSSDSRKPTSQLRRLSPPHSQSESRICECGTRFPDLADDGTIWHYLALLEGCRFSNSNRFNELRSHPVLVGTLLVLISAARSLTPIRPGRTTDKIIATPRWQHVELAFLATKIARSSRSLLRRGHVGSVDCRFVAGAIFDILVQSSRTESNRRDDSTDWIKLRESVGERPPDYAECRRILPTERTDAHGLCL
jgi:hypothetical protein